MKTEKCVRILLLLGCLALFSVQQSTAGIAPVGLGRIITNNTGHDANDFHYTIDYPPGGNVDKIKSKGTFPDVKGTDNGNGTYTMELSGATVKAGERAKILNIWYENNPALPCPNTASYDGGYWTIDGKPVAGGLPGAGINVTNRPGGGVIAGLTNSLDQGIWIKNISIVTGFKWGIDDLDYEKPLPAGYNFSLLSAYKELLPGESVYWNFININIGDPILFQYETAWLNHLDPPGYDQEIVYSRAGHGSPIPEPSTLLLLGAGLAAFGLLSRRMSR